VGGIPITDERFASLQTTTQGLARAAEGRVVISGQTARLVRRAFITEALTESARNAVGSGKVVVGALPEIDQGKFIGRRKALRLLGSLLAAATRLEPQIVVVRGETGLGKTRLLAEAQRRLRHGDFNLALYTASCPLNGASVPWSALSAMLHVLCGTQEDDDPNRIREVRPRLRALGLNDEQSEAVLGLLGAPQTVLPRETRSLLRASLERMVLSLCRDRLHCFAWDDAQAIDRETLDALLRIVRRQKRLRGVFILAQRGEVPARLLKVKGTHLLELEELSERDTKRLIAARLGARSVPQELLEFVRAAAGGHPLFVEELVRELCDTAAIQVMNGNVTMKSDCHATAPRTLRNLIADRVSRLPQRERRVLQGIAILGEPAYTPVLASVLDRPLPTLDHSLTNLVARNLVRRTGATRVRLASPLYRDIVVDAMPDTAQRDLHARAANTYEESDVRSVGDAAERIANHWLAAGEQSRSVDLFWQSAHERLASGQLEHAMRSMLRGAELADMASRSVEQLAKWLADIAQTASQVRQGPGLKDAVSAAVREVETRGSQEQRTHAYIHLARALGSVNLFDEAFEALATSRYEDVDDVRLKREALSATVELALRKGLFREAATASDRLEQLGALDDERALLVMAVARAGTGDTEAALSHLDRVDKLSKPKNAAEAVLRQKQRVLIHFNARNFETAADEATKLTSMAREAGLRFDTAAALHNLGDACYRLGDHPRAYAALVESLEISRTLEHERLTALNQMHLCLLDGLRGNDDAEQRLKSLIRYADGRGYLWDVLEGRYLYACLLVHKGKGEQARRHLQDVITMSDEHGHTLIGINAREQLEQL